MKSGCSFTWQSICAGINTFKRGAIWRIGDGSQVNIWSDPWIAGSADGRVVTPRGANLLSKVADLIDPVTGVWDQELVMDTFWQVDAERILAIPLTPQSMMEDFVAWRFTKNNMFTVRSAYHAEWDHQFGRWFERTEGQQSQRYPVWAKLWESSLPGKIKIHAWKVLHGFVPCFGVLANRHIALPTNCPMCAGGCEDIKHALLPVQERRKYGDV